MACFLFWQTPVNMLTACILRQRSINGTGLQRGCLWIAILCHKGSNKLRKCRSPMASIAFVIDIGTGFIMSIGNTLNDKCDKAPFTIYHLTCFFIEVYDDWFTFTLQSLPINATYSQIYILIHTSIPGSLSIWAKSISKGPFNVHRSCKWSDKNGNVGVVLSVQFHLAHYGKRYVSVWLHEKKTLRATWTDLFIISANLIPWLIWQFSLLNIESQCHIALHTKAFVW